MEKTKNTMESFQTEGFKIVRDGKVIILTNEEMASFRELDQALTGRECIDIILDCGDYTQEETKILRTAMENTTECFEIEQDILDALFEDAGETEFEVINNYLKRAKNELRKISMHIEANTKNNIAYKPDWVRFTYLKNNQLYRIKYSLNGELLKSGDNKIDCVYKGFLVPWTFTINGQELTDKNDEIISCEFIKELFKNSDISIGFTVTDNVDMSTKENVDKVFRDEISSGKGQIEIIVNDQPERIEFQFESISNYCL